MQRCLDLALKAEGLTYPNPIVGAVIVHEGRIIGEGYHIRAGGPHAEVIAIESVKESRLLRSSKLYVSLEPCSHFGRTPPCADLIIARKIPEVVIGTTDTSEKVGGRGIKKLRDAGCIVTVGVEEEKCRWINKRFFTFNEKKRPYIILKWACSADGFLDVVRHPESPRMVNWITGNPERILVHRWRASEQAILAGAGTIRADNPMLNIREWKGNNPLRLILNGSGSLPVNPAISNTPGTNIIFTFFPEKVIAGTAVRLNEEQPSAEQVAGYLYDRGIQSLFVEGGARVLDHFISTGYWDEARIFRGSQLFGNGVRAPLIGGKLVSHTRFSHSTLDILVRE